MERMVLVVADTNKQDRRRDAARSGVCGALAPACCDPSCYCDLDCAANRGPSLSPSYCQGELQLPVASSKVAGGGLCGL